MKFLKSKFFVLLFSIFISIIILLVFEPILTADTLIFPYAVHPFDIVNSFPKLWNYIKIAYCVTLFISSFFILNSINIFFKFNKVPKTNKKPKSNNIVEKNNFSLLIGNNANTYEKVFIPEKGLYQNILITGTIGSRKNKFSYVPIVKSINEI